MNDHATIKITSNLYEEKIVINKPGIEIRPKEKGGEVTIKQNSEPCFVIDVGEHNVCSLHNLRILLKAPDSNNPETQVEEEESVSNFEKAGSEICMREFFGLGKNNGHSTANSTSFFAEPKPYKHLSIILVKSGTLKLHDCNFSLDGVENDTTRKVPCITVLMGARVEMHNCKLKGDRTNDANTAGIVAVNADVLIEKCDF